MLLNSDLFQKDHSLLIFNLQAVFIQEEFPEFRDLKMWEVILVPLSSVYKYIRSWEFYPHVKFSFSIAQSKTNGKWLLERSRVW